MLFIIFFNYVNQITLYNNTSIVEGVDDNNFNILGWWKTNSTTYLILVRMEKDLLIPSTSIVASESTLSVEGWVLNCKHSKLNA